MITHDVERRLLLADRILLMTNAPRRASPRFVDNTLPKERTRAELPQAGELLTLAQPLIEFLVYRSRELALAPDPAEKRAATRHRPPK